MKLCPSCGEAAEVQRMGSSVRADEPGSKEGHKGDVVGVCYPSRL